MLAASWFELGILETNIEVDKRQYTIRLDKPYSFDTGRATPASSH